MAKKGTTPTRSTSSSRSWPSPSTSRTKRWPRPRNGRPMAEPSSCRGRAPAGRAALAGAAPRPRAGRRRRLPHAEPVRPAGPSPAEVSARAEAELETLKRTLVLAQKTADATIREAEEEARRMIVKAERDAEARRGRHPSRLLEEIAQPSTPGAPRCSPTWRPWSATSTSSGLRLAELDHRAAAPPWRTRPPAADAGALDDVGRPAGRSAPRPRQRCRLRARPGGDRPGGARPPAPAPSPGPAPAPPPLPASAFGGTDDDAWARYGTNDRSSRTLGPPDPADPAARRPRVPPGLLGPVGRERRRTSTSSASAMLDDTGALDLTTSTISTTWTTSGQPLAWFGRRR